MILKKSKRILLKGLLAGTAIMTFASPVLLSTYQANASTAYDLSQYQGYLSARQVKRLKSEVSFVILRAQDGGVIPDRTFSHNVKLLNKYHLPYGVYSYSLYASPAQAKGSARALFNRAPQAKFYVNDIEQNNTNGTLNKSTADWAKEIHNETNKPAVLYSGENFMSTNITQRTRNQYNAIWLAAYGSEPDPNYHYDLWQFADNHYSRALGKALDADTFPDGNNKPLSFWIGNNGNNPTNPSNPSDNNNAPSSNKRHTSSNVQPINQDTKDALIKAQQEAITKGEIHEQKNKRTIKSLRRQIANDKSQINNLAQKANTNQTQQLQQLQAQNKMQSIALQRDNQELANDNNAINTLKSKVSQVTNMLKGYVRDILSPAKYSHYYSGDSVHYVKVIKRRGISIYTKHGNHKIDHVNKGTILHVDHFKYERSHNHLITKAIGYYGWTKNGNARMVSFTSNKSYVRASNLEF